MSTDSASKRVVPVLSAANFIIGMGAFMVVGLLNPLSADLGVAPGTAGWLMISYAIGYAVLSPVLVSLTGTVGRRRLLAAGLGIFALSNLVGACAPTFEILLVSRILAAAGAGLVTPVAAAVAAGLSPANRQARALTAVFFGLTLSQVLGVPIGGFIAYSFGWRAAFALVFALSLPVIYLIWTRIPAGLQFRPVSLSDLGATMINPKQMLVLSFSALFVGTSYVVYTYIAPLLSETMRFERDGITLFLLISGVGAVIGNLVGGHIIDRIGAYRTLLILVLAQVLILPVFSALPIPVPALMIIAFFWAAFGWSYNAAQQIRLISLSPENASVLLALNAAALYVGTAIGSWVGAGVITAFGLGALGFAATCGALLCAVHLVLTNRVTTRAL